MKEKILLLVLVSLPLFMFAQDKTEERISIASDLGIGNEFQLNQTSVQFLGVVSDSRCPKQVTCIWPGEAKVLLGITIGGQYFEREVVIKSTGAELPLTKNLQILVSNLRPYPETANGIDPEEYCLRISAAFSSEDQ